MTSRNWTAIRPGRATAFLLLDDGSASPAARRLVSGPTALPTRPHGLPPRAARWARGIAAAWLVAAGPALAADGSAAETKEESVEQGAPAASEAESGSAGEGTELDPNRVVFDRLMVVGGPDRLRDVPGSAHVITAADLATQRFFDVHQALRQVPGINLQEEDGYGLRPNIGMRGSGSERSAKITLLEDGVLIAPAPYAAPAAYYFPVVGRMEAIEVRKGSSSIRQGPFTNGGVLNLISTSIPSELGGRLELFAGEDDTVRGRLTVGDSQERHGWLLETYQARTDGFKRLDGGGDTGVDLEDYLVKLRVNSRPGALRYQALELKVGRTEQRGDETYLGLTEADFRRDPYRRYAASQLDTIDTEHEQIQLRHFLQLRSELDLTTTLYRNDFFRNWAKLDSVRGVGIAAILAAPEERGGELAILRGEVDSAPGDLTLRNNRRDYYSQGLQSVLAWRPDERQDLELGVRLHRDEEDRFQEDDRYQMVDGRMTFGAAGAPGSQANRVSDAEALALFVQDRIRLGRWTLTPGLRFETIDFTRTDFGAHDPQRAAPTRVRRNSVEVWIPGLGVDFLIDPKTSVFAGVHKGFAPPGPGADQATEAEESVNYELGLRHEADGFGYQVVAFYNDYENLLGRDTLASGGSGSGDLFNGGEVEVRGLELSAQADLGRSLDLAVELPVRLAYTYTAAEFQNGFASDFEPWGPEVAAGDELPYLPKHQVFARLGILHGRWSGFLDSSWVDEMRTSSGSGPIPQGEGTDEHLVFDLSAAFELAGGVKLLGQVRNLTDEVYVAARQPAGARPGLPRTLLLGFEWGF
jgi:Fe(3+) dicitrate transport protein